MDGAAEDFLSPVGAGAANLRRFDAADLAAYVPESGWRDSAMPGVAGRALFRGGRIASGITVTRSFCRFDRAYDAAISHAAPTAMLVFGEKGCSRFDLSGASFDVLPGDVWLMRVDERPLRRRTPSGIDSAMTVFKFDAARVAAAVGGDGFPGFGAAVRLGRNEVACRRLGGILGNPLASPLDRLLAEGESLALLARWLGPPQRSRRRPPGSPATMRVGSVASSRVWSRIWPRRRASMRWLSLRE